MGDVQPSTTRLAPLAPINLGSDLKVGATFSVSAHLELIILTTAPLSTKNSTFRFTIVPATRKEL